MSLWRHLRKDPLAMVAFGLLCVLLLAAMIGLVAGADPQAIGTMRLQPPSSGAWLGTDSLGRDLFARVLEGTRTTVLISVVAVLISTLVAIVLGITAAVVGGVVDIVVMRVADALLAFPAVLLGIVVAAIVGGGPRAAVTTIVIVTLPLMLRVFRTAAVEVVHRDFYTASQVGGAGLVRLSTKHVVRNIAGAIAVQLTYAASVAMLVEGSISFLGFGVAPPGASLGSLVQDGAPYLTLAPWLALAPGCVLALAIMSINLLGDTLRDALEPREERGLQ
ncbi:MAG: ABC transporter permease [Cellulomonadaceae bacterium]|nr:ABC transporter permease [Cellulomonadaceae bacterium]